MELVEAKLPESPSTGRSPERAACGRLIEQLTRVPGCFEVVDLPKSKPVGSIASMLREEIHAQGKFGWKVRQSRGRVFVVKEGKS